MNKDATILVAGGTGFLGTAVVQLLRQNGYTNILTPSRRDGWDFTNETRVADYFEHWNPEYVVNLAALAGGIGLNQAVPAKMFHTNMAMGLNITHQAWERGCRKYIFVGSICSYPKYTKPPFKEIDLWNGYPEETNAPYGVVKKAIGVMLDAYNQQYGFKCNYLLPVNLYGPHDNFDLESSHVIPALIRKFTEARKSGLNEVILWGDGSPTREFLFVNDCAEAIVTALESQLTKPVPINLGTGREISVKDLADLIASYTGYTGRIIWDTTKPNGQPRRCLDTERAHSILNWQARTNLEDGLRQTIAWYATTGGSQ